jgi:hypothetical protein
VASQPLSLCLNDNFIFCEAYNPKRFGVFLHSSFCILHFLGFPSDLDLALRLPPVAVYNPRHAVSSEIMHS